MTGRIDGRILAWSVLESEMDMSKWAWLMCGYLWPVFDRLSSVDVSM